ncbi:hypothetical protein BDZ45DRAFT_755405 [Acephala macrosclerotiorum]|nr:hypothetical protein BDZ45DRAFT_755405 [Acephala macrosclerotiorum]
MANEQNLIIFRDELPDPEALLYDQRLYILDSFTLFLNSPSSCALQSGILPSSRAKQKSTEIATKTPNLPAAFPTYSLAPSSRVMQQQNCKKYINPKIDTLVLVGFGLIDMRYLGLMDSPKTLRKPMEEVRSLEVHQAWWIEDMGPRMVSGPFAECSTMERLFHGMVASGRVRGLRKLYLKPPVGKYTVHLTEEKQERSRKFMGGVFGKFVKTVPGLKIPEVILMS